MENEDYDDIDDQDFADFFEDCTLVEDGVIENQAANLDNLDAEPRQLVEGDDLEDDNNCNVGQLIVKYEGEEGEDVGMRAATGVIIKDLGDDKYAVLTSCYPFITSTDGLANITEGQFFLQRNGIKKYAARFTMDVAKVVTYKDYEMSPHAPSEGKDIALCVVKFVNGNKDAMDEIAQILPTNPNMFGQNSFYVGGYPHATIQDGLGLSPSKYFHYSMTGKIQDMKILEEGNYGVILHSTDCSSGQNGAPLYVDGLKKGRFIGGLHSGVAEFENVANGFKDDTYYTATVITKHLYEDFIVPTLESFS